MKNIFYAGDLHGRLSDLGRIVMSAEAKQFDAIVQVGDFGIGFPGRHTIRWIEKRAFQGKWTVPLYTCFGNHDSWDLYDAYFDANPDENLFELVPDSGVYVVRRGAVIDIAGIKHIFLGGAESTDKHRRIEGVSYWAREEPSRAEFNLFFDNWETEKPDTVVTHDAPLRIDIKRMRRNSSHTPRNLESVCKLTKHSPRHWVFGHHHSIEKWKVQKTKYYCCGLHGQGWLRGFNDDGSWFRKKE